LGAHSINVIIEKLLPKLLEKYIVIHQTGTVKKFDDLARLTNLKNKLPDVQKKFYYPAGYFSSNQIGYIYSLTDIIIGRSGANTFFEVIALKIPAIFIPLPWSANQEQQQQAKLLQKMGAGEYFDQEDDLNKLLILIDKIITNLDSYRRNLDKLQTLYAPDAVSIIKKNIDTTLAQN
jgi:UDP-N-acetylglucosamine--N-acetylmuramyl-(pentapeptide) pyrophosphoryl-undecaprenol N-acetylglucosamine transferase